MDLYAPPDWFIIAMFLLLALLLILIVVWAIRRSQGHVRKMEIEVEKQKLDLLAKDLNTQAKVTPLYQAQHRPDPVNPHS